jgi:hypothetical protein
MRWLPTELDPKRMIAERTLEAVRALLRAQAVYAGTRVSGGGTVLVRVEEHAPLNEVGGVARVTDGGSGAVAVARIGRGSFVAYQLEPQGLRELPVEIDATDGSLRVQCAVRS